MTPEQARIELMIKPEGEFTKQSIAFYREAFPENNDFPDEVVIKILLKSMKGHCDCCKDQKS